MPTKQVICADCDVVFTVDVQRGRVPIYCKSCRADRDRASNRRKQYAWRAKNPEKWKAATDRANAKKLADPEFLRRKREAERRRLYGMDADEFERLLASQCGLCAICGKPPLGQANGGARPGHEPSLHVDHCHTNGHVRGLLCSNCNTMLGLAGDDPAILDRAAEYLRR